MINVRNLQGNSKVWLRGWESAQDCARLVNLSPLVSLMQSADYIHSLVHMAQIQAAEISPL